MPKHRVPESTPPPIDSIEILAPKVTYKLTSLSAATIWRLRKRGEFPDPVRLSPGRMGWRRRDVEAWIAARQDVAECLRPRLAYAARQRRAR